MDFNKLLEDFARIPQVVEKAKTRTQNQSEIEDAIVRFSPDYFEACEILDALMVGLESRFDEQDLKDAIECHRWYKEALNKADMKRSRAPDEMDLAKWSKDERPS